MLRTGAAAVTLGVASLAAGAVAHADPLEERAVLQVAGPRSGDSLGGLVRQGGDANGDGRADLVVSTRPGSDPGRGPVTGFAAFLPGSAATGRHVLSGPRIGPLRGSGANAPADGGGDLNGDGLADAVVGSPEEGRAYLIFGDRALHNVDVAVLGGGGFAVSAGAHGHLGSAVTMAGDVNGDGLGDALIADSQHYDFTPPQTGTAYVVFGSPSASPIDVGSLGDRGFRIDNVPLSAFATGAVAGVGDVNGDGLADIALGAPTAAASGRDGAGQAYVVFGKRDTMPVNVRADFAGFRIDGAAAGDGAGTAVAPAGDANGDGKADVAIGAPTSDARGRRDAGTAYVVLGKNDRNPVELSVAQALEIDGEEPSALAGAALAPAGDVNRDGITDLLVGSPGLATPRPNAGAAYVVYGAAAPTVRDLAALGDGGLSFRGGSFGSFAGASVAPAGDLNSDGRADFAIGAPGDNRVYIVYGYTAGGGCANPRVGTASADSLTGTGAGDRIAGAPGGDLLRGLGDADCLRGGDGNDRLVGDAGNDRLVGDAGNDRLTGGRGRDTYTAGRGNDRIDSADGVRERVDCGPGRDTVRADRKDTLRHCERARRITAASHDRTVR